jgi:NADPH:quinone reductase-like Zn-dependent oxidoreductase
MLFVNPMTALSFFEIARKEGHRAIISLAAASALGKMIRQLGREKGIPVVNVVRRKEQEDLLRTEGAQYVLTSTDPDFSIKAGELVRDLRPGLLLDPIGGKQEPDLFEAMPPRSHRIIYGTLSDEPLQLAPRNLINEDKRVSGFFLADFLHQAGLFRTSLLLIQARKMLAGDHPVHVRECISPESINEAIARYLKEMTAGKIIILP